MRWEKRITLGRGVQIILALKLIIARWGRTRELGRERRSGRKEGGREREKEREEFELCLCSILLHKHMPGSMGAKNVLSL